MISTSSCVARSRAASQFWFRLRLRNFASSELGEALGCTQMIPPNLRARAGAR